MGVFPRVHVGEASRIGRSGIVMLPTDGRGVLVIRNRGPDVSAATNFRPWGKRSVPGHEIPQGGARDVPTSNETIRSMPRVGRLRRPVPTSELEIPEGHPGSTTGTGPGPSPISSVIVALRHWPSGGSEFIPFVTRPLDDRLLPPVSRAARHGTPMGIPTGLSHTAAESRRLGVQRHRASKGEDHGRSPRLERVRGQSPHASSFTSLLNG
jgi:hypothetical protein